MLRGLCEEEGRRSLRRKENISEENRFHIQKRQHFTLPFFKLNRMNRLLLNLVFKIDSVFLLKSLHHLYQFFEAFVDN